MESYVTEYDSINVERPQSPLNINPVSKAVVVILVCYAIYLYIG